MIELYLLYFFHGALNTSNDQTSKYLHNKLIRVINMVTCYNHSFLIDNVTT